MLTEKQIIEIREHLESSQNPLFFFDNDADGLTSYILLRRFIGRGNGVVVKSYPGLDESYTRKIREFNPDKIFILDKPEVKEDFFDYTRERNLPVVWIDHHGVKNSEGIYYYNPMANSPPNNEPVSYLCQKVTQKDEWVSLLGCIGDYYLPDFTPKLAREFPDLLLKHKTPAEMRYESEMGRLTRIIEFALKDKTSSVIRMLRALIAAKGPYEILKGEKPYEFMLKRYEQIKKKYDVLIDKAKNMKHGKIIFFRYSGDLSISAEISNELTYHFPEKVVVVAYVRDGVVKVSLRGGKKDLRVIVSKIIEKLGGTGGGHEKACGMVVKLQDMDTFKELLEKEFQ
ncbi:MAG: hypothetical protein KKE23_02715 [Nanoarchaeota archaeon]|nr:hypothetical protein [Nanoarchaeota archaeon]